jgi:tRNA uridine 5-carbamoylmethylation protein Kti12
MAINLLEIEPHKVSRDLKGYSVFFYGEPKSGKTTTAAHFPKALLLAFEKGYNAIPGIMAQPINKWSEFKSVLRELKKEEVKQKFETIIIDTADIAYDYCTKYICDNTKRPDGSFGVDSVSDIPYGKGYGMVGQEFDECLRSIVQMDYGLVIISHATDKTFRNESGEEYNQIVPTLDKRGTNIVSRMADIIGYSRIVDTEAGEKTMLFMRGTNRYMAGSRFKYTPDYIEFSYENLTNAIAEAIDAQAKEDGQQFFTNEKSNLYLKKDNELDFDKLMLEFQDVINRIIKKANSEEVFQNEYTPKITQITDKYLGRGNKVSQCSREQVEALSLIVEELKELEK